MMQQSYSIYQQYKKICPLSKDTYPGTAADLKRWEWHIKNCSDKTDFEQVEIPDYVVDFFEKRRAKTFEDLPEHVKPAFFFIATHYPEQDVYATGSYVNGDYFDKTCPVFVSEYRAMLGKSKISDLDYIVVGTGPEFNFKLPGAHRLKYLPAGEQKILIPMWNWQNIPDDEKPKIKKAIEYNRWEDVLRINNKYMVSPYTICCDITQMKKAYINKNDKGFFG